MYYVPSTSQMREPRARSTKNGSLPTLRSARTGEFTPPGIRFRARLNSSDETEVISSHKNSRAKIQEALAAASAYLLSSALDTSAATTIFGAPNTGGVAKW